MKHKILKCALGIVEIVVFSDGLNPDIVLFVRTVSDDARWCYDGDNRQDLLPGGKFTALEFLEEYLRYAEKYGVLGDYWNVVDIGTFHFAPEAVELAKRALEEWGK